MLAAIRGLTMNLDADHLKIQKPQLSTSLLTLNKIHNIMWIVTQMNHDTEQASKSICKIEIKENHKKVWMWFYSQASIISPMEQMVYAQVYQMPGIKYMALDYCHSDFSKFIASILKNFHVLTMIYSGMEN